MQEVNPAMVHILLWEASTVLTTFVGCIFLVVSLPMSVALSSWHLHAGAAIRCSDNPFCDAA